MSRTNQGQLRELELRAGDLERAMKQIGVLLVDETLTPKMRMQRAIGVLSMYGCAVPSAPRPIEAK